MQATYQIAMDNGVFPAEGGYTNNKADPGGPTNWGITIHDARQYWKSGATAEDIREMPKAIADSIYVLHYANPIRYSDLPPGIDYSVLDYAINSGIPRAVKTLQEIVDVPADGIMGPQTISATNKMDTIQTIHQIWDQRLAYDHSLTRLWPVFGHGWTDRCIKGKKFALSLYNQYGLNKPTSINPVTPSSHNPWGDLIKDLEIIIIELAKWIPLNKRIIK